MFQDIQEIKKYVNVSVQLDMKLLEPYIEEALRVRVYPFVPKKVCEQIANEPYYELLKKAVANYAVAYSIPFLKVHLSNTGGNNFVDGKTQKASWWDLRDFGISAVGVADRALNGLVSELSKTLYAFQITSFQNPIFSNINEFEKHHSLGGSLSVYAKLLPIINEVSERFMQEYLSEFCMIEALFAQMKANDTIWKYFQRAVAQATVAESVSSGAFSYTNEAIIIQWDELPWQQSKILDDKQLQSKIHHCMQQVRMYLALALEWIRKEKLRNPNLLTCFVDKDVSRKPIAKKSGLYL